MCKDLRSRYGPPYLSDGVEVIRRFHGSRDVTLHCDLEVPLLRIQRSSVKDARYDLLVNPTSKHFGIAIPIFQNIKVLRECDLCIFLQPILWVDDAKRIQRCMFGETALELLYELGDSPCHIITTTLN
jgi:hypothetical protein